MSMTFPDLGPDELQSLCDGLLPCPFCGGRLIVIEDDLMDEFDEDGSLLSLEDGGFHIGHGGEPDSCAIWDHLIFDEGGACEWNRRMPGVAQ